MTERRALVALASVRTLANSNDQVTGATGVVRWSESERVGMFTSTSLAGGTCYFTAQIQMLAPNLPSIIASRYVPVRLIAQGGMGAVYEVEHSRTGERLALKVLLLGVGSSPEAIERFRREARASAKIKSEHVVRVIDADVAPELDGAPFLVMELLEGMDLERATLASPPSHSTVVDWLRQVARAIDKAHRLGIVHRDLKPENLFLATVEDRPAIVKVLDFGIVKMTEEGTGATGSGVIVGTPKYMAPEQASSRGKVTPATDRYALGLVAYRLLAGESYYEGDLMSILGELVHERLEPPSKRHSGFSAAFDEWFLKACHRDPEKRFSSAAEQIESLSAVLGLPTLAIETTRDPIPNPASGRSRLARGIVPVVAVVIALVAAAAAFRQWRASANGPDATPAAGTPQASRIQAAATAPAPAVPAAPSAPTPALAIVPASTAVSAAAQPSLTDAPKDMPLVSATASGLRASRHGSGKTPSARATVSSERPAVKSENPAAADPYADQK